MKIGIDIDGTITAAPPLFSVLTRALRKEGHEVVIVTFRDKGYRPETVEDIEIPRTATVFIASGASTPEELILEVVRRLESRAARPDSTPFEGGGP